MTKFEGFALGMILVLHAMYLKSTFDRIAVIEAQVEELCVTVNCD